LTLADRVRNGDLMVSQNIGLWFNSDAWSEAVSVAQIKALAGQTAAAYRMLQ